MNNRERFLNTLRFEPVDHPPLLLGGPWFETRRRWEQEGLPAGVDLYEYFDLEPVSLVNVSIETRLFPAFPEELLQEDDTYVILRTAKGSIVKRRKEMRHSGAEHYLEYAVKGPADREWLAARLDPANAERFRNGWEQRLAENRGRRLTLVDFGSFFGDLHEHMGTEQTALAFYDCPDFVHWYNDRIAAICEAGIERVLPAGGVDLMGGHEDMAYKGASMLSPAMFREFMAPYYRRTVGKARALGQWLFLMDSDGDINELIPEWLAVGVNMFTPCEVAAGMDVRRLRAEYGREVLLMGGLDKRAFARGKEEVKAELQAKLPLAAEGGYIPTFDHGVPPDVPWENYRYYVELSKEILGIG